MFVAISPMSQKSICKVPEKKYQSFKKNGEKVRETDQHTNQQTDKFHWLAQLKLEYSHMICWENLGPLLKNQNFPRHAVFPES